MLRTNMAWLPLFGRHAQLCEQYASNTFTLRLLIWKLRDPAIVDSD